MNKGTVLREDALVEDALQKLLQHTNIKGEWVPKRLPGDKGIDGNILLHIDGNQLMLNAEVKKEIRQYHLEVIIDLATQYPPFILVAQHITPAIKEQLKEHKIAYLDGAGNIFLNFPGQLIIVEGNKIQKEDKPTPNRAFTKTGLKVLYLLLTEVEAIHWTYREIADQTDVALGNIPMVFAGLKEAGFILPINKTRFILQNKQELLERWLTGYREVLRPALHLGTYQWMNNNVDWKDKELKDGNVWGGEPAANILTGYLNPEKLTIYLQGTKHHLTKDWRLVPNPNGNIQLYQKFWTNNKHTNTAIAPALIVYADLVLTDDPRNMETAEIIYTNYLQQIFE